MHESRAKHRFLLRLAELLHSHGTPANRLERVLTKMAETLEVEAVFLSTPTAVQTAFGSGADERTYMRRVSPGDVNLGKLVDFDIVMEEVGDGRLSVDEGLEALERIANAGPHYSKVVVALAFGLASAGAARLFGGGPMDVATSFAIGPIIFALSVLLQRRPSGMEAFEPLAAFLVAFSALLIARVLPIDDRIVTLSSLIIIIPGLTLTTALTELATRHLVSGVSRLAGAAAVFLTILLGVALAWRLGDFLPPAIGAAPIHAELWSEILTVAVVPFAFAVVFDARPRECAPIFFVCVAGFTAVRLGTVPLGPYLAPFLGAFVVGVLSNIYARMHNHPALVPQTPAMLLLVPGSLGYRSLISFLERESLEGMEWLFQTGMVGVSLVGGLLAANAILPPRRIL